MNIGVDSKNSYIDGIGVSILTEKLESTFCIKCHFSENDKTPNTDGFFVLSTKTCPEKEFHVQIKSTEKLENSSFSYDTKFINYVNSGVTDNPSFIFAIDITERKIYYKYLSNDFLKENNFLDTEQKSITIHFGENEILDDANAFKEILEDIYLSSKIKTFQAKQMDMVEYQTAYDKLNSFFDNDFKKLKDKAFPNVWKFGIIYNREKLPKSLYEEIKRTRDEFGIGTSPYNSTFSVYRIDYGSNQNIFQNFKLSLDDKKLKLPIQSYMSSGIGTENGMDGDIIDWLRHTFKDLITAQTSFISFMPIDALFEIIFNFIDREIFLRNNKQIKDLYDHYYKNCELDTKIVYDMVYKTTPASCTSKELILVKLSMDEIIKRDIPKVKRVWEIDESTPTLNIHNPSIIYRNTYKLFSKLPIYYSEFISKLFSTEISNKYCAQGEYIIYLDIRMISGNLIEKSKYFKVDRNKPFKIEVSNDLKFVREHDENYNIYGSGILNASFRFRVNNIIENLLNILYKKVCKIHGFKLEHLQNRTDF